MPEENTRTICPFTGASDAWTEIQFPDGVWEGRSADGSTIHAEDQAGLIREYNAIANTNRRVQELIAAHGSAVDAHDNYSAYLATFEDEIKAAQATHADNERVKTLAAADAINANIIPDEYQPYREASDAYNDSAKSVHNAQSNRDMAEPFRQRVVGELKALARKETK